MAKGRRNTTDRILDSPVPGGDSGYTPGNARHNDFEDPEVFRLIKAIFDMNTLLIEKMNTLQDDMDDIHDAYENGDLGGSSTDEYDLP